MSERHILLPLRSLRSLAGLLTSADIVRPHCHVLITIIRYHLPTIIMVTCCEDQTHAGRLPSVARLAYTDYLHAGSFWRQITSCKHAITCQKGRMSHNTHYGRWAIIGDHVRTSYTACASLATLARGSADLCRRRTTTLSRSYHHITVSFAYDHHGNMVRRSNTCRQHRKHAKTAFWLILTAEIRHVNMS